MIKILILTMLFSLGVQASPITGFPEKSLTIDLSKADPRLQDPKYGGQILSFLGCKQTLADIWKYGFADDCNAFVAAGFLNEIKDQGLKFRASPAVRVTAPDTNRYELYLSLRAGTPEVILDEVYIRGDQILDFYKNISTIGINGTKFELK